MVYPTLLVLLLFQIMKKATIQGRLGTPPSTVSFIVTLQIQNEIEINLFSDETYVHHKLD